MLPHSVKWLYVEPGWELITPARSFLSVQERLFSIIDEQDSMPVINMLANHAGISYTEVLESDLHWIASYSNFSAKRLQKEQAAHERAMAQIKSRRR